MSMDEQSILRIKPAKLYAIAEDELLKALKAVLTESAISFINNVVVPRIEDMIANPDKWLAKGYASFKVNHYPSHEFITEVSRLLTPLGYRVEETHDGVGMYAMVVIYWKEI